jgi:hypothetical protein
VPPPETAGDMGGTESPRFRWTGKIRTRQRRLPLPEGLGWVHNGSAMHAGQRARMLRNPVRRKRPPVVGPESTYIGGDLRGTLRTSRNHPFSSWAS